MNAGDEAERRVRAECREWLTLLHSGEASEGDRQRFNAWLHADPRHERAYSRLQSLWQEIGGLRHLADLEPVPSLPRSRPHAAQSSARIRRSLPHAWGWAAAAAAAGLAVVMAWNQFGTKTPQNVAALAFAEAYASGLGEVRDVALPDGSIVTLAPLTNVQVEMSDRERRVRLDAGEVFFAVTKDATRPFRVDAHGAVVRVVGTQFDVRAHDDYVRVTVAEGRVLVNDRSDPLVGGQRIDVLSDGSLTRFAEAVDVGTWRNGRLVYEGAPLADVVADLSRYRRGISIASGAGELRVTAGLRVEQMDAFLDGLPHTLPVRVRRDGDTVAIARSE